MLVPLLPLLFLIHVSSPNQICLPEVSEPEPDATAVITGLFKVRSDGSENLKSSTSNLPTIVGTPAVIFTESVNVDISNRQKDHQLKSICGAVSPRGLQTLEAANWIINLLNTQSGTVFGKPVADSFVPGVKIGLRMLDTCGNDDLAVGHLTNSFMSLYSDSSMCSANQTALNLGVLQSTSPPGEHLTSQLQIPVAVYGATGVDPPQRSRRIRMSASNALTAKMMVKTARRFAWDQASIVYSNDEFGKQGRDMLMQEAREHGLCTATIRALPTNIHSSHWEKLVDRIVQNLPSTPAVLVYADKKHVVKLLQVYSDRLGEDKMRPSGQPQLTWIMADSFDRSSSSFEGLTIDTVRGVFVVGADSPSRIAEFDIHWTSLRPPVEASDSDTIAKWRRHFYQKHIGCKFQNERSEEFEDLALCQEGATISMGLPETNPTLVTVIDTVYAYALTLREAWERNCAGSRGLCPKLANIPRSELVEILHDVKFIHSDDIRSPQSLHGRLVDIKHPASIASVHELLQDGSGVKYTKILTYNTVNASIRQHNPPIFYLTNVVGQTVQTATPPASICLGDCAQCSTSDQSPSYIYGAGDVTLAAVFPIHNIASNPYICGAIRETENSYQLAEAFWYALENVNSDLGPFKQILKGVHLGGLAIDSCLSPPRTSYMLTSVINRQQTVKSSPMTEEPLTLDPSDIIGFIGSAYDNTTLHMASILKYTGLTQISYGGNSVELDDETEYGDVLSTDVSDTSRLKLLLSLISEVGWDYVQIVHSQSHYGINTERQLRSLADDSWVCIAQSVHINASQPNSAYDAVESMLSQAQNGATVVIVLAETNHINALLTQLNGKDHSLTFLAPKYWQRSADKQISAAKSGGTNAIVLDVEPAVNHAFTEFFSNLKVGKQINRNPWFVEYVQATLNCAYEDEHQVNNSKCNPKASLGKNKNLVVDAKANDVINSVYAYAFGLHSVLKQLCDNSYDGLCHGFRSLSNQERNARLRAAIKQVKFRDESDRDFGFSENWDSISKITVYAFRRHKKGLAPQFIQIGTTPTGDANIMQTEMRKYYRSRASKCEDSSKCGQCRTAVMPETLTTPAMSVLTTTNNPTVRRKPVDSKLFAHADGDILLGGLFPVHHSSVDDPFKCGNLSEQGILMLESFLWAIDTINKNSQVLRGIKMGAFALDTCESSGETYTGLSELFSSPGLVTNGSIKINADRVFGFVNAPNGEPAKTASQILNSYLITNVGPSFPSNLLANPVDVEYSLRSSVPDEIQIKAVINLLQRLNWTFVSVVHSPGAQGNAQLLQFRSKASEAGICIATVQPFSFTMDTMETSILKLKQQAISGAKAVVLLVTDSEQVQLLLRAIKMAENKRILSPNAFNLVSTAGWGSASETMQGLGHVALGALTLEYDSQPLDPLYDHLQGLQYSQDTPNPWWKEYWMNKYDCSTDSQCMRTRPLQVSIPQVSANIINSVWAMAVGFSNLQQELCGAEGGFCRAMREEVDLRARILHHVRSVAFTRADDPTKMFRFTAGGWADAGLNLMNVVRASKRDSDRVTYRKIGLFANDTLQMTIVPMGVRENDMTPLRDIPSRCTDSVKCSQCAARTIYTTPAPLVTSTNTPTTTSTTLPPTTSTEIVRTTSTMSIGLPESVQSAAIYNNALLFEPAPSGVDQLIVASVLPIHARGSGPLSCGTIDSHNYQLYESIRWALQEINRDAKLLPGIHLSPLVLDSCGQPTKAVQDLSNLLSHQVEFNVNGTRIDPNKILSVISGPGSEETLAISRLLSPRQIPLLSPGAEVSLEQLGNLYPTETLLRTGVSTSVQSRAIVEILERINWKSVSMLYSEDLWGANGFQDFKASLRERQLCLALAQPIPSMGSSSNCSSISDAVDRAVDRLKSLADVGVYGVVVWLEPNSLVCLWEAVMRALQSGRLIPGSMIWVLPSNVPDIGTILAGKETAGLGLLQVRHQAVHVANFQRYWKFITPSPVDQPLWRQEFFESTFGCVGAQCSKLTLASKPYVENAYLSSAVRSVYSLAYALESIRLRMCGPGTVGICSRLKQEAMLPSLLLSAMQRSKYPDPVDTSGSHLMGFNADGFMSDYVEIMNLRKNEKSFEFRTVGHYNESAHGAGVNSLEMSLAPQGYENGEQAFLLRDRPSDCRDATVSICQACKSQPSPVVDDLVKHADNNQQHASEKMAELSFGSERVLQDMMLVPSRNKFMLASILPIHRGVDGTGFSCGSINLATGFQRLAALLFAIKEVNNNAYILPGVDLGAVVVDSCSSEERALANWFEVMAAGGPGKINPSDIVGVIGMDVQESDHIGHVIQSMNVPHIATVPTPLSLRNQPYALGTVPSENVHIQILGDISVTMEWTYVSVLYETNEVHKPTADAMITELERKGVCVAGAIPVDPHADMESVQLAVRKLVLLAGARTVYVFVSDSTMLNFMKALSAERVAEGRFIVVTAFNEDWAYDVEFLSSLAQFRQGLLTIEVQRHNNTKFVEYLQSLNLQNHDHIPTAWFHEFWQTQHQCHLTNSPVSLASHFAIPCSGLERINASEVQQSPSVLPTVLAVQAAARGLTNFIRKSCPGRLVTSLSDCGGGVEQRWRKEYLQQIKGVNFTYAYAPQKPAVWVNFDGHGFIETEYSVRNLLRQLDGNYQYREVGVWKPGKGLTLNIKQVTLLNSQGQMQVPESECPRPPCAQCSNSSVLSSINTPPASERFDTVWAVIISALASLGMVVCVICIIYFIVTFPIAYGTTVCGYMILCGLFLVYAMSFMYILHPSEWVCSVRRFGTGLCWSVVLAPMLVKVLHTWQMPSHQLDEAKLVEAGYEANTSPSTLFFTSVAIAAVQGIIASEWLVLVRPSPLTFVSFFGDAKLDPGEWRCSPGADFEAGVVSSMCFVVVLLGVTLIFSLLTWNSDVHNRESRWIFAACLFTGAIWTCWSLIATQVNYRLRDPTIAIGLVSNATVILMCLYMRKAYIYQKYRQEAKGGYMDAQSQSIYHPSSALGSYMLNTGSIYSTSKMIHNNGLHAANPLFVQALPDNHASRNHQHPAIVDPNGMIYSNAAYDGGSEFNPGAYSSNSTLPRGSAQGVMFVDGQRTGEASHRL